MRILAIRGKNLASLAAEFEILLEEGALQHAGLFAITGQTGAGKSTLLDALCLALYDQIPRLPKGNGVSIGHKDESENTRVNSHDVSSILRRGTANGYAEVDFIGSDKQIYRSHWAISRARNKVNGRLQTQKITLTHCQSNEIIGHTKTETLKEIASKIGLSFDQFRRSVLLAQGDFAAFLKAKKDERSSLLEKMTGTDIYSQLSEAAFDRATKEKQALTTIQEKLHDKIPLTTEERRALEEQREALKTQQATLASQTESKQKQLAWYKTKEQLEQELADLQTQTNQITAQWDSQAEQRDLLKKIDEVQVLRPLLQQQAQLNKDCHSANEELSAHQESLSLANDKQAILIKQTTAAELTYTTHKKTWQDSQVLLTQAQILDTQIRENKAHGEQLKEEDSSQNAALKTTKTNLNQLHNKSNSLAQSITNSEQWQEQHTELTPLINEWGRWESDLKTLTHCQQELAQLAQKEHHLNEGLTDTQANLVQLKSADALFIQQKSPLIDSLEKLTLYWKNTSLEEINQARHTLEQEKNSLEKNLQRAEKQLVLQSELQREQENLTALVKTELTLTKENTALIAQQKITSAQLSEAQQSFHLLQAANNRSVKELRASLSEGTPCSVCGSEDHPWAKEHNPLQQATAEQDLRVKQLNQEKEDNIKRLAGLGSQQAQLTKDIAFCQTQIAEYTLQLKSPDFSSEVSNELIEQFKVDIVDINTRYLAAQTKQSEALTQQKQRENQQAQLQELDDKHSAHTKKITLLNEKIKLDSQQQASIKSSVSRETYKKNELIASLSTPLQSIEDWQIRVSEDPSFTMQLQQSVQHWQKCDQEINTANLKLIDIQQKIKVAESENQQQLKIQQKIRLEIETQQTNLQQLINNRQSYFSGKPAKEVAQQLQQTLAVAEKKQRQLNKELTELQLEIKTQQQSIKHWQSEILRREEAHKQINHDLAQELQKHKLSLETLNSHLSHSENWIKQENTRQQALLQTKQQTAAFLSVKQSTLKTHQENQATEEKENLLEILQQLQTEQEENNAAMESCVFALRTDDEKIAAGQHLAKSIKKQTEIWEQWESLNDLIGSKNGQKFRIFAQGLTLETLLAYTNEHLQEFAKRYSLERVNGSDLELQVIDRDMADEIRSVHSLSGGESFLVSLALALGLASLSSNRIQVESLFIDEGFGSLDPETLDIAIASLDTLQSLGRKVAVISHVPALVERIGTQIKVEKQGGGHSTIKVCSNN
ncbi:MAG: AAA family ATPase [Methyloprofundus sp.]|nr:AAA family ATPase [Methyloprofundus sp.]